MVQATCLDKYKDNNNVIIGYRIQTDDGKIGDVTSKELKKAIINKQITVSNLRLTKDNKLVTAKAHNPNKHTRVFISQKILSGVNCEKNLSFKTDVDIPTIKLKANLLGLEIHEIEKSLYILESPTDIKLITDANKIVATTGANLFHSTKFNSIDMTNVDTSTMVNGYQMFASCRARNINVSNINTSNMEQMNAMFAHCKLDTLKIDNFNTRNAKSMCAMFNNTEIDELDLGSFDTSKVKEMSFMFKGSKIHKLNLSSFDTSRVEIAHEMFKDAVIDNIDISNFNVKGMRAMIGMFQGVKTNELNIGDFVASDLIQNIDALFTNAHIHKLILTNTNLRKRAMEKEKIDNWEEIKHLFK